VLAAARRLTGRQWLGGLLLIVGLGATVALAFIAGAKKPPSQSVQVGLAALSILANAGASFAFSGVGRADPSHARQSAARLIRTATQAASARETAERAFEANLPKVALHSAMGMMSVHLSYIEDGLIGAVDDWRVFHPYAVEQAEGSTDDRSGDHDDD